MKTKELTALPSLVIMPDGSEKELDAFTHEEREEWNRIICQQISEAMSEMYTNKLQKWNIIVKKKNS